MSETDEKLKYIKELTNELTTFTNGNLNQTNINNFLFGKIADLLVTQGKTVRLVKKLVESVEILTENNNELVDALEEALQKKGEVVE
jgi:hypothetical protein